MRWATPLPRTPLTRVNPAMPHIYEQSPFLSARNFPIIHSLMDCKEYTTLASEPINPTDVVVLPCGLPEPRRYQRCHKAVSAPTPVPTIHGMFVRNGLNLSEGIAV